MPHQRSESNEVVLIRLKKLSSEAVTQQMWVDLDACDR